jgi:hypothetical protein
MSFDRSSVQAKLIEDPELYYEFMSLKKRKQNELLYFFIRRLNRKIQSISRTVEPINRNYQKIPTKFRNHQNVSTFAPQNCTSQNTVSI